MVDVLIAVAAGYLIGALPLGLLVSWGIAGTDIRRHGTGNMGAANVRETLGRFPAAIVALGVFLQGLLPPLFASSLTDSETAAAAAAVGAMVGYGWTVFLRFGGGKAVGVGTGAAAAISPVGFVVLLLSFVVGALLKQTSLGVLLGFVIFASYVCYFIGFAPYGLAAILLLAVIVVKRLDCVRDEIRHGPFLRVIINLMLFQKRPEHDSD